MNALPERAWMLADEDGDIVGYSQPRDDLTEYIRADLVAAKDAEIERLTTEQQALLRVAGALLYDWPDYGMDGFDVQDLLLTQGLLEPVTITQTLLDSCDDETCGCRDYFGSDSDALGESCNRLTDLGKRARAALQEQGDE